MVLAVIVLPSLWRARQSLEHANALRIARLERKAILEEKRFLNSVQAIPHMRRVLSLRLTTDDGLFAPLSAGYLPPTLYNKMPDATQFNQKSNNLTPVRYSVYDWGSRENRNDFRYAPVFYVEAAMSTLPHWQQMDTSSSKDSVSSDNKESPGQPDQEQQEEEQSEEESKIRFWLQWAPLTRVHYGVVKLMDEAFEMYVQLGIAREDLEDVREQLTRRPLHVIAAMQAIGFIQVWLSMMAFKNDVAFFKGRSDYTGLSSRSMITDFVHGVVIFLYVFDYEHASRIVLFQLGLGVIVDAWKVKRRMRLHIFWRYALPWVGGAQESIDDKSSDAAQRAQERGEAATEEIDAICMRYLKMIMYPLAAAWGIYCLYYYQYNSWWSWFISSAADFAYAFGFVNMTPQIFLNYKLKSVAHMPWRVLLYKSFNTFIDDFFAFVLMADRMSDKHRWMTLRDDLVFFVFLFQLWCYPLDKSRADEYGFVYEQSSTGEACEDKEENQQGTPQAQLADQQVKSKKE